MLNKILLIILLVIICTGCSTISGNKDEQLPNFHLTADEITVKNVVFDIRIPKKESDIFKYLTEILKIYIGADLLKDISGKSSASDSSIFN